MIDDLLRDTLADDRWDLPVPPGALERVRLAHAQRRRGTAAATALGGLALVGATVAGLSLLPSHDDHLGTWAAGGVPAGSPVPSISPSWAPESGRDWLLTRQQSEAFWAGHTRPSPAPGGSVVPSPAPLGPQSERLLGDVLAADLPTGTQTRREDAAGGQPNASVVHLTLPDGTPVKVLRSWAQGPFPFDYEDGYDHSDARVEDIPGTATAGVAYSQFGYGFGPRYGNTAHGVITVSRGGEWTTWAAPDTVPVATLKAWAFAAARHAGD